MYKAKQYGPTEPKHSLYRIRRVWLCVWNKRDHTQWATKAIINSRWREIRFLCFDYSRWYNIAPQHILVSGCYSIMRGDLAYLLIRLLLVLFSASKVVVVLDTSAVSSSSSVRLEFILRGHRIWLTFHDVFGQIQIQIQHIRSHVINVSYLKFQKI